MKKSNHTETFPVKGIKTYFPHILHLRDNFLFLMSLGLSFWCYFYYHELN